MSVMSGINYVIGKTICFVWVLFFCTPCTQASTLPPDPNNAALLYYQAFLLRPEPNYADKELVYNTNIEKIYEFLCGAKIEFDTDTEERICELEKKLNDFGTEPNESKSDLEIMMSPDTDSKGFIYEMFHMLREQREHERKMNGVDPNKTIRNYIRKCHDMIALAQAASELSECDWGIRYSSGLACSIPQLIEIRNLIAVLGADVLLLTVDGDYRAAVERCLMMRRFARHVGDDEILLYTTSNRLAGYAIRCIRIALGCMEPDLDILTWLKNQLVTEKGLIASPASVLKIDFEMTLQSLRTNADILENAHLALRKKREIKSLTREQHTQKGDNSGDLQSLTDEELVALAGKPYATFLDSAIRIMDSEMSYEKKQSEIRSLTEALEKEFGGDSTAMLKMITHPERLLIFSIRTACAEQVLKIYDVHVLYIADFNALMTGIEVYLTKAKTGQLPEKLPEGVPKDPFTGRDFTYEIKEDGFVLSLPDENIPKQKHRPYEFKVKR